MKKAFPIARTLVLVALTGSGLLLAQAPRTADVQFKAAQHKEEVEGDLKGAIEQYQKIAQSGDRALAAKALVQMGRAYEKLGSVEAQKAYDRVLRDFADQKDAAAAARTRLTALNPGVFTANRIALGVRQVWAGPDVDIEGTPTPDGHFLTFIDWSTGDVGAKNLATGEKRRLTNKGSWTDSWEYGEWPVVSPDGKQVAHAWLNREAFYDLRVRPFTPAADGTPSRVIYRNEDVGYLQPFAWSPDGKQILTLLSRRDFTNQMVLISAADGSTRILKSLEWRYPSKMSFSPDGRYIAYDVRVREDSPDRDIFVLSVDGQWEVPLVEHPAIDHAPVWTPDGKGILFVSDRRGNTGLWMNRVENGKPQGAPELVKPDMGAMTPLAFLRDGSYYYGVRTGTEDVYTVELNPRTGEVSGTPARFTERFTGSNLAGVWSPDGRRFAYFSRRGPLVFERGPGAMAVMIRSLDTGDEREFLLNLEFDRRWPFARWFPDNRSLLIATRDSRGRWGIHRLDTQTGIVTPIRQALGADGFPGLAPLLSPDGRTVYYFRNARGPLAALRAEPSTIVAYEIETGRQEELFRAPSLKRVLALALSRDGKRFAFVLEGSLQVMLVNGGEPREIFRDQDGDSLVGASRIEWTGDDRFILFVTQHLRDNAKTDLWRISPDGAARQKVLSMDDGFNALSLPSAHPDGRRLAFTAGQREASAVWVMENFLPQSLAAR